MGAFVGRDSERVAIDRMAAEARATGRPAAAFVFGAPGSGKSRLLGEVRRLLARDGGSLEVTGYEPEREIPLAASRSLMRGLAAKGSDAGSRLERLVFGDPTADPVDALRIFDAVERSLASLDAPAIVVDDLQWVDRSSLALLHYLLRTAPEAGRPLIMVAMSRETPEARAFSEAVVQTLVQTGQALALELGPLDESSGVELARSVSDRIPTAQARDIWRQAEGSPFWIEALARGGPAADLDELVTARLRGAGPDAREALSLGAVVGRPLAHDEAAATLGWPDTRARAASSALVDHGLTVPTERGARVAHDLIREAVLARLPAPERVRLHRLVATRLGSTAEGDPQLLREALEHRVAAGLPTVELALRVARSPQRRLLDEQGLALLARTADDAPTADPIALDLAVEVATLAADLGRPTLALERWKAVRTRLPTPAARASAALEASRLALRLGRGEEAEALLAEARPPADLPVPLRIELDVHESILMRHVRHDPEEAGRSLERAVAVARRLAIGAGGAAALDETARRAYLTALGGAYDAARMDHDDAVAMLAVADEAASIPTTSEWRALGARFNQGLALRALGRWAEAATTLQRVWDDAERWAFPAIAAETGYWLADTLRVLGRWDDAARAAQATMELGARVEDSRAVSDARWVLQAIALSRRDWQATVAEIERDLAQESDPHYRIEIRATIAAWLARLGGTERAADALAHIEAASDDALAGCRRCRTESAIANVGTLARLGLPERAGTLAADVDRTAGQPSPVAAARRRWSGALVDLASGEAGAARQQLDAAAEALDAMGMRPESLWVRIDAAGAAEASDGRDEAVGRLLHARDQALGLGATSELGVVDRSLRRLGVRTWRRGRAPGAEDTLTGRSREVAQLVAAGASNPEIAASLFLSRKTVESHVSALLARYDVRNRTELATRLGELSVLDPEA